MSFMGCEWQGKSGRGAGDKLAKGTKEGNIEKNERFATNPSHSEGWQRRNLTERKPLTRRIYSNTNSMEGWETIFQYNS